jgi:hypothetical protein
LVAPFGNNPGGNMGEDAEGWWTRMPCMPSETGAQCEKKVCVVTFKITCHKFMSCHIPWNGAIMWSTDANNTQELW